MTVRCPMSSSAFSVFTEAFYPSHERVRIVPYSVWVDVIVLGRSAQNDGTKGVEDPRRDLDLSGQSAPTDNVPTAG
jgi:hypothetical protein